ncbi:MAG: phosphoribosylglycinamide formyltransferase [Treponema sp.]|jgi:phosphoribosylglycinamide formyltransferase-1|nr:phosphoribosylglycinamide formyltransferase [Treponema sp.]
MKLRTCVLVSGGGTNLQALIDYQKEKGESCPYEIVVVISDHKDAFALERAKNAGIPTAIKSPYAVMGKETAQAASREEKRLAVSNAMLQVCNEYKVDAIVEAGCLTVLVGDILTKYENKIINLHPALLPKFGGVGMWGHHVHEAVLAAGEKESGCTVHLVTSECDGGKILLQKKVPVMPDDTPDTLYARIAPEEHKAIVEGLLLLCNQ